MSAHTPGPWKNGRDKNGNCIICQTDDVLPGELSYSEEFQANRRLIDAAPDLLALAHKYAGECAECGGDGLCVKPRDGRGSAGSVRRCQDCADIWAVIDRAEGRA